MRRIDRNTRAGGTAAGSRSHTGAAQILRPRSPAPSISGKHLMVQLADIATGLPTIVNAVKQARAGHGGKMQIALAAGTPLGMMGKGPKFPSWMGPRIGPGVSTAEHAQGLENGTIKDFLMELDKQGGQTFFDRANPMLKHDYPLATEKRFFRDPNHSNPKKQLGEALAQMNQDTPTNRGFLLWMMRHHFGRPN